MPRAIGKGEEKGTVKIKLRVCPRYQTSVLNDERGVDMRPFPFSATVYFEGEMVCMIHCWHILGVSPALAGLLTELH